MSASGDFAIPMSFPRERDPGTGTKNKIDTDWQLSVLRIQITRILQWQLDNSTTNVLAYRTIRMFESAIALKSIVSFYLSPTVNRWTSNLVYQFGKINILVTMLTYIRFIKNTVACKKLVTVIWFTANMFSSTHKQRRSLQKNYRISLIVEWHCKMPKCLIPVPWLDYQKNCSCLSVQGHDFFP